MPRLTADQLGQLPPRKSKLEWALEHARNGYHVHPLRPNGKEPLTPHGFKDATRNLEQIRTWWRQWPDANIGIATGASGLLVADLDVKNGGKGPETWSALVAGIEYESGFSCTTPTGGLHLIWRDRVGVPSSNGQVAKSIDIKSIGGYVVAPGSEIDDETYRTTTGEPLPQIESLPAASEALQGVAVSREAKKGARAGTGTRKPTLAELLSSPPLRGTGTTNDWLTRVAGHYAKMHRDKRDLYETEVRRAAAMVDPDYEDTEKVLESVWGTEQDGRPSRVRPQALDDASLVDAVAGAFRSRWCWSGAHGWREWDGKIWASRTEPALVERVRTHMQEMYWVLSAETSDPSYAKQLGSLLGGGRVRGVAGFLKGALEVDSLAFDNRRELLNCRNGVVDLRSGEIRPHDPALLLTKITSTDYLPDATHPDWDKALESVREGDRAWLQVRVGQAITGYRVTDELMPVLYGGGRNGKTTFLSSVQSAFGTYARAVSDRVLTARDSDHPTELTDLQGLRLAVIEELPEAVPLSVKRLKDTVGQPTITARKIAKDTVTWETTHALFLATNHKPRVNETDHGTWRRLALVRFPFVFDGKDGIGHMPSDPGLHDRMRRGDQGRAEAVLAWCVAGAMRWFNANRVFPPLPDQIVADTEDWRGESDVIITYIADRLEFDPQTAVGTSDLLADLNDWLNAKGKAPWGDQLMTERLGTHERVTVHGVEKKLTRIAASGVVVIGRTGKPLRDQPERARLWVGMGFRADTASTPEIPW